MVESQEGGLTSQEFRANMTHWLKYIADHMTREYVLLMQQFRVHDGEQMHISIVI